MKNLLFVCSSNLDRSPLAESLFRDNERFEAKSCGTLPHADILVSSEAVLWSDIIFCMEDSHKFYLVQTIPEALGKDIRVLNVPDLARNDPELERKLREKLRGYLDA
jgi:predicted protein tyrosine phosphatase